METRQPDNPDSMASLLEAMAATPKVTRLFGLGTMVGHYRILRLIGRGGMADVYLARDTQLGRKVALKVVHAHELGSQRASERFQLEARTTARFNHPHITTIYSVGDEGGRPYVALEYLDGESLRERMSQEPLSVPQILRITLAIAQALQEAHSVGVLHRDLKPANVMLPRDGRLRVLDFGLAKVLKHQDFQRAPGDPARPGPAVVETLALTSILALDPVASESPVQGVCGTPAYMAPEQWANQSLSPATDVWALGIMLHELLTGRRPYPQSDLLQLAWQVCESTPVPPLEMNHDVPSGLKELVERCLSKDPALRPTVASVVERTQRMLAHDRVLKGGAGSPFRGLLPFDERHQHLFYGRDEEIAAFLERLREEPILLVVGPSGAGKSSFVQAGIIPRVREQGALVVLKLRPGSQPFRTLATRIVAAEWQHANPNGTSVTRSKNLPDGDARVDKGDPLAPTVPLDPGESREEAVDNLAKQLRAGPNQLNLFLHRLAERAQRNVLLYVDQLEELFTLVSDISEQRLFAQALYLAADDPQLPVRVIFTLRDEFLARLADSAGPRQTLGQVTVLQRLGGAALREILTKPVREVGYAYEDPALVPEMVAEVADEISCLPLLQFTCELLWDQRDRHGHTLCRAVYKEIGGVGGALAHHADTVLAALTAEERQLARILVLRLVSADGTRRVISRDQAVEGLEDGAERVLHHLTSSRLITAVQAEHVSEPQLELTHESLIVNWSRLASWIDESREELVFIAEAEQAAALWERRGRRDAEVWLEDALAEARKKLAMCVAEPPQQVQRFLEAGNLRERIQKRRRRLRWMSVVVVLTLIALTASAAAVVVLRQKNEVKRQKSLVMKHLTRAEERRAEAQREGAKSALARGDLLEARAKLRTSLEAADSTLGRLLWWQLEQRPLVWSQRIHYPRSVAFSPDGMTLAASSHNGSAYLLNVQTRAVRILRADFGWALSIAFSPDGKHLAMGTLLGKIMVWNLRTQSRRVLSGHKGQVRSIAFSPDSHRLASASHDGTVRIWRTDTGLLVRSLHGHSGAVRSVSFSPDGKRLASAGMDGTVRLWKLATGKQGRVFRKHKRAVCAVLHSPSGQWIVSSGFDRVIRVQDASTGKQLRVLRGHRASVCSLAISPDGQLLASGSRDQTVRIWRMPSGQAVRVFREPTGTIRGLAFSPDGRLLAGVALDELLRLWDVRKDNVRVTEPRAALSHRAGPNQSAHRVTVNVALFSPDQRIIASGGSDHVVRLQDATTGAILKELHGHQKSIRLMDFSPRGEFLVSASEDLTARLWQVATGRLIRAFMGHTQKVLSPTFSPDGRFVLTTGADRTIRLWSSRTGALLRTFRGHTGLVYQAQFSPDGRSFLSTSLDSSIRLWDFTSGRLIRELRGHKGGVYGARFSPHGKRIASTGVDRSVRIWDVATGNGRLLAKYPSSVYWLDWHPDGQRLGIPMGDGTARIVDLKTGSTVVLRGHEGEVNSVRFSRDGKLAVTASDDGTVRAWDVATGLPRWRAPVMLGSPPELYSHLGWHRFGRSGSAPVKEQRWRRAVEQHARLGAEDKSGHLLCLATGSRGLQLWDTAQDQLLVQQPEVEIQDLRATRSGCVVLTVQGKALLVGRQGRLMTLQRHASAIEVTRGQILVAAQTKALVFDESGKRLAKFAADSGATAISRTAQQIILGYRDGNLEFVSTSARQTRPNLLFEAMPSSMVTRLAVGPSKTLVIGYANGVLGLWSLENGARLHQTRLTGRVAHLLLTRKRLYAASALGEKRVWNLGTLFISRCALLRQIWAQVGVVWERGRPVVRPPPSPHSCHASRR